LGFIEWKTLLDKSSAAGLQAGRKSSGQEDGKRREQEILLNLGKKTEPEEDNNFKPADLPHFQTTAVNSGRFAQARFHLPPDFAGESFDFGQMIAAFLCNPFQWPARWSV